MDRLVDKLVDEFVDDEPVDRLVVDELVDELVELQFSTCFLNRLILWFVSTGLKCPHAGFPFKHPNRYFPSEVLHTLHLSSMFRRAFDILRSSGMPSATLTKTMLVDITDSRKKELCVCHQMCHKKNICS